MDDDACKQTLIDRASQDDPDALEKLLERHLPRLLAYVRSRAHPSIRDHESCTDIVQSVCRDVLENVDRFEYRGDAPFRKWLFTKALSKLIDRKRFYLCRKRSPVGMSQVSQTQLEEICATLDSPSQVAMAKEQLERLERAFVKLTEDDQRVITLSRLVGIGTAEIAAEMDRSQGAVRVLLHRAIGRLGLLMHKERLSG